MLGEFAGVLLLLAVAIIVASAMVSAPKLLGPKREFPEKQDPFECGEKQIVSPKQRFSVKFYLVAMTVFTIPLVLGLVYEWRKGALEW